MSVTDINSSAYIDTHDQLGSDHQFNNRILCLIYHAPETVELMIIHVAKWMNQNGKLHINVISGRLGVALRIKPGQRHETKLGLKFSDVIINGIRPHVVNSYHLHHMKSVEQWESVMNKALNSVDEVTPAVTVTPTPAPVSATPTPAPAPVTLATKIIDAIKDENRIIFWGRPLEELETAVKMITDNNTIVPKEITSPDAIKDRRYSFDVMALTGNDWKITGNSAIRISNPNHQYAVLNSSAKIIILAEGSMEEIEKSNMLDLTDKEFKVIKFINPIPIRSHRFVEI